MVCCIHVIAAAIFAIWCKDSGFCDFLLILHAPFHIKRPCFKLILWLLLLHLFILSSTKQCFSYVLGWLLSYLHAESLNHYANVQDINYLIAPENYAGNKFIHKMLSKVELLLRQCTSIAKAELSRFRSIKPYQFAVVYSIYWLLISHEYTGSHCQLFITHSTAIKQCRTAPGMICQDYEYRVFFMLDFILLFL